MRAFALGASFMAMSGCSLFWSLGGLEGGAACDGGACVQGEPPADALSEPPLPPGDTGPANEGGRDSTSPEASANEGGRDTGGAPGDASDANPDCTPPTPPTLDDCTGIVALPAAPSIDGVIECGVPLWPMPVVASQGPGAVPPTAQASLGVAWRPDGVYYFLRVTGLGATRYPPPPGANSSWCGDAVEFYVDDDGRYANPPLYDDPGTIQLIAVAPSNAMGSTSTGYSFRDGTEVAPWTGQFTVVATSDGFDAEAFVVAADLGLSTWSLVQGGKIGMDVAVDVGDPAGQSGTCPRLSQFTIQLPVTDASCPQAACNIHEFCNPQLGP